MPYVTRRVFEHCVDRSRQGQEVEVVHSYILQDVEMLGRATTVDPVCGADEFAREAYRVAGADPSRVVPVDRRATRWASRPRYSCLQETASALDPQLRPRSIHDGLVETWSRPAPQRM